MATFNFGRFLRKRSIRSILTAWSEDFGLWDENQSLILGKELPGNPRYSVKVGEEVIGWMQGEQRFHHLLQHLVEQEIEKKQLANEVLDKYKEINLLFQLSEKITASRELSNACHLIIDEVRKLIEITNGSVHLFSERVGTLEPLATWGEGGYLQASIYPAEGLIGDVFVAGKGEVVNDLSLDQRYLFPYDRVRAIICVPLKIGNCTFGVATFGHHLPRDYRAEDLKLLNSIASMSSPMIDAARIHAEQLKDAQEREEKLKRQITELRIEVDTVRRSRHMAEITETDFFQKLQEKQQRKQLPETP